MSWYVHYKVLRVPLNECGLGWLENEDDAEYALRSKHPEAVAFHDLGKFNVTYTSHGWFLDYLLEYKSDCDGEYGKVRELKESEKDMYRPMFEVVCPEIDMNKVRLVEYCYYNCCEPDGYYDITTDPFYNTLPFICSIESLL